MMVQIVQGLFRQSDASVKRFSPEEMVSVFLELATNNAEKPK